MAVLAEFEPEFVEHNLAAEARRLLRQAGIGVEDESEVTLAFSMTGRARSASYQGVGRCYTGASVSGTMTLSAPGRDEIVVPLSYDLPATSIVFSTDCQSEADGAPYTGAISIAMIPALVKLWRGAMVPVLLDVTSAGVTDSVYDLQRKAVAIDAFRGLDDDEIDAVQTVAFLESVINLVEYLVETGFSPHKADVAARRLLEAYAGKNFGVATMDDVAEWREWLAEWESADQD